MMRRLLLPLAIVLNACAPATQSDLPSRTMIAESTLPPMKSFAARAPQSQRTANNHLLEDFLDLSFQMESGRALPVFTRFEQPISLRLTGRPAPTMQADLRGLLARLQKEAGLDIAITDTSSAQITIESVPQSAIRRVLPQAACFVAPNVTSLSEFRSSRRSSKTNWATLTERNKLVIVLPNDTSPQEVRDCLHEELAQALGPLNDLYRLPNSVFNDDNVHTVLTDFDMLVLRATYAPELSSGMTRAQVAERLPAILERINPRGRAPGPARSTFTPQSYVRAIQTALGPGASMSERRAAADKAVQIAMSSGWTDTRRGFAHYARGRVLQVSDPQAAHQEYQMADRVYARSSQTRLHRAYVATQLGAYALSQGQDKSAQTLVDPHISRARNAQNAALLATLQLLKAEALLMQGKTAEANALRLDSLGWARYGFGADWSVERKIREIASLSKAEPPA
ncbi:MAG: DUF2927 domain-containing protein [Roseobacter sp.]|jgi:hypothetical protein